MAPWPLETIIGILLVIYALASWMQLLGYSAYGRTSSNKLALPNKISWFLMESPNLFWIYYFAKTHSFQLNLPMFLFMIHYINRTIIYPLRSTSHSKMAVVASAAAFVYTSMNGYLQYKGNSRFGFNQELSIVQMTGVLVFVAGMVINVVSDQILREKRQKTQQGKYTVVNEFLFKYVTMANYFGQIVQWFGYAMVAQTYGAVIFAVGTLNCLMSAGLERHRWNLAKIDNYPKDKKAVIPFVF